MFDGSLPEIADLASLTDAELVDAAGGWARSENAAGARKVAVMAEIFARRTGLPAGERELWWIDPEAAVACELAAAVNVSQGMALHQTHRGVALRDRLPKVAVLFEQGLISDLLVRTIVWRTYLITDEAAMAAVDAELAARITAWGALSAAKTETAIDALVEQHDPAALRRSRESLSRQTVEFGSPSDPPGTTTLWARLNSPDAALMEDRVEEMAHSVCGADPRTADQRRAHALTAAVLHTGFGCRCGDNDCPGASAADAPAKNAVVYAVVDDKFVPCADSEDTSPDDTGDDDSEGDRGGAADADGDGASRSAAEAAAAAANRPANRARCAAPPAYVFGAGILPTPLLGAILDRARIREVRHPGHDSAPEPRYTPTQSTAEFVRCRDLTCRFPNCDKPAQVCDLDHTVPYPIGPTHPSNLKCLCRFHHMIKTFWTGVTGFRERQLPDGTVIWTYPTGHTYTTYPGSLHLFPSLCRPTATLWTGDPPVLEPCGDRGVMMPKRRHTRAQYTAKAIAAERKLNEDQPQPRPLSTTAALPPVRGQTFWEWLAALPPGDDTPPPF
jgi:hypothetical protein